MDDDWGNVDPYLSELDSVPGVYEILDGSIRYFQKVNALEYQMRYEPIPI